MKQSQQVHLHPSSLKPFQTSMPQLDYDVSQMRRSTNYKPSLWKYDFLESLTSKYDRKEYKMEVEILVKEVRSMFAETEDLKAMLELIDSIKKLGLSFHFEEEVKTCLDKIANTYIIKTQKYDVLREDLYLVSLCFRLLRQHGYPVSQEMLRGFRDKVNGVLELEKVVVELLEASNVGFEGENTLDEARAFALEILTRCFGNDLASHALELPWHWRVDWFDVKWQVNVREKNVSHVSSVLVALAKLHFNVVQASLQRDIRQLSCWWKNIGVTQKVDFARDRLVESFMCSVGLAHQPHYTCLRICLTKVVNFILIIDDVYDLYGSLEELKHFTNAVERWDFRETQNLPDCMKICFQALHDTTCDIAKDIETELGYTLVLPLLRKAWAGFCKSWLVEAEWYHNGYIPSFEEYLSNAWISSSGPLLFIHSYFSARHEHTQDISDFHQENHDLVYNISIIIRLCNDIGTSAAEQERGDAPSSILCYMKETNETEDVARKHIRGMIASTWKRINMNCLGPTSDTITNDVSPFVNIMLNMARVAHNLYQSGDAFGVHVSDNKKRIISLLVPIFLLLQVYIIKIRLMYLLKINIKQFTFI